MSARTSDWYSRKRDARMTDEEAAAQFICKHLQLTLRRSGSTERYF